MAGRGCRGKSGHAVCFHVATWPSQGQEPGLRPVEEVSGPFAWKCGHHGRGVEVGGGVGRR
eukprot:8711979-Alexandrium_andersonii.AAC.1